MHEVKGRIMLNRQRQILSDCKTKVGCLKMLTACFLFIICLFYDT